MICSNKIKVVNNRKYIRVKCPICRLKRLVQIDDINRSAKFTGRCKKCYYLQMKNWKGKNNPHWKGGISVSGSCAYKRIIGIQKYRTYYSMMSNGGVRISRLNVAIALRRPLTREEIIHHIDGNVSNDNLNNLALFKSCSRHRKFHEICNHNDHNKIDISKYAITFKEGECV